MHSDLEHNIFSLEITVYIVAFPQQLISPDRLKILSGLNLYQCLLKLYEQYIPKINTMGIVVSEAPSGRGLREAVEESALRSNLIKF